MIILVLMNYKKCECKLRGTAYTVPEARIEENVLTSWDRGFNTKAKKSGELKQGVYI